MGADLSCGSEEAWVAVAWAVPAGQLLEGLGSLRRAALLVKPPNCAAGWARRRRGLNRKLGKARGAEAGKWPSRVISQGCPERSAELRRKGGA